MKEKIHSICMNKILIFVLIFLAIIFSFIPDSFGYSYTGSVYNTDFTINVDESIYSNYDYFIISAVRFDNGKYRYCVIYSDAKIYYSDGFLTVDSNEDNSYRLHSYSRFSNNAVNTINLSASDFSSSTSISVSISEVVFSTRDITDFNDKLVFQGAPAQGEQQEGTQGVQALTLEQVEQIPQAMTQTLQVVIPVGLVVFGIGLVIFLTRYLILRLM